MANNNKNNQPKAEDKNKNKGNVAAQKQQGSKQEKAKEEAPLIPTVAAETVETPVLPKSTQSKENTVKAMTPDGKVQFATLLQKRYIDNPDAGIKYGQKLIDEIDNFIDGTVMLTMIDIRDEAVSKGVDVNLLFKNGTRAFEIVEACKMLGINLPKPKLLTDGQTSIEFKDATVDETVQAAVDNEKKARKQIAEKIPELDPSKITTDDEIKAALEYQMRSTPNVLKSLVNSIEWLRSLRNFKAQSADEKLKLEDRTIGVWVEEILGIIKPTLLLTGIGRAVYVNAAQDGTPITAHCSVRRNVKDEDGKSILNEEQIAELVVTLLKANAKFSLAKEPEAMKGKALTDDRAIKNLMTGSQELIEKILAKGDDLEKKIYSIVLKQYYPNPEGDMTEKMRVKIGQLMNLYLPVEERMDAYPAIDEEQEYPETKEEGAAATAEEKKN